MSKSKRKGSFFDFDLDDFNLSFVFDGKVSKPAKEPVFPGEFSVKAFADLKFPDIKLYDIDGDGINNYRDCNPFNRKQQHFPETSMAVRNVIPLPQEKPQKDIELELSERYGGATSLDDQVYSFSDEQTAGKYQDERKINVQQKEPDDLTTFNVFVPSTREQSKPISEDEHKERVMGMKASLKRKFGDDIEERTAHGSWVSGERELIREPVTRLTVRTDPKRFEKHEGELEQLVEGRGFLWGQSAMAVEVENLHKGSRKQGMHFMSLTDEDISYLV